MTRLRIVKKRGFKLLHFVEIKTWFGWKEIYNGTLEECEVFLDNYPVKVIKEIEK